jgi:two-component system, OmpR family, response regulator
LIWYKVAPPEAPELDTPGPATPRTRLSPVAEMSSLSDMPIFVVDDDLALVESLLDLLADEGYSAQGFTHPGDALALIRAGARPRVILLDYFMPELTGEEFLSALAETGVEVPVLLLSGASELHPRGKVAAVIMKPFDIDRLLVELERQTGRAQP